MNKTYCGNYIEQQFGATHTCKEGDWQCTSCQLIDVEAERDRLRDALEAIDEFSPAVSVLEIKQFAKEALENKG